MFIMNIEYCILIMVAKYHIYLFNDLDSGRSDKNEGRRRWQYSLPCLRICWRNKLKYITMDKYVAMIGTAPFQPYNPKPMLVL